MQNREAYKAAIKAAREELAEIEQKIATMEPLLRRKATIESFLGLADALQGPAPSPDKPFTPVRRISLDDSTPGQGPVNGNGSALLIPGMSDRQIWEGARDAIADAKHPMMAPWIVSAMRERGWKLDAK